MTPLTLRRMTFAVLAVAVGITGIALGLARAGTPTRAADSHPALPPVGQLQYQRVDAPARTIARTPSGEVVATMTDGARTVALLGPQRTFADPDYTAGVLMGQDESGGFAVLDAQDRRLQVGSGDRSQRIRTYNFPQGRITDHRVEGLTLYDLPNIVAGDLDGLIGRLIHEHQADELARLSAS